MKRGMTNLYTALSHHFLDLAVADRIHHVPTHAHRIISYSKWLLLNAIVTIHPPEPVAGSYTGNR
jgi:hypothetical protein